MRPLAAALALLVGSASASATDLLTLLDQAEAYDPQLRAATARLESGRQGERIARSVFLPQVNASADYVQSDTDASFPTDTGERQSISTNSRSRSFGVSLSQQIYNRASFSDLEAANAETARLEAEYEQSYEAFLLRVAEAYFAVLTQIDQVAFSRSQEEALSRQLEQAQQRFEVGLTAITDVHEARARFDQARAATIVSENALEDAREALRELTGATPASIRALARDLKMTGPEPADPEAWVARALAENPRLKSLEQQRLAAEAGIESARAARWPTVSGTLSYSDSRDLGDSRPFSADESSGTSARIGVDIPLYTGGRVSARIQQAVFSRDAAVEGLEQERRATTRTARNAYRAVLASISEVEARQQALISAQSALEATQAGFEVGTRTIVDVLLSQQTLFLAQSDLSRARHAFILNGLRLKQATGTLARTDLETVNALLDGNG